MKRIIGAILILYFLGINFYGALEMLNDKRIAEQNGIIKQYNSLLKRSRYDTKSKIAEKWRTPEKAFFRISYMGGGTGIWFGMQYYNHKTRKPGFIYNIPTYMGISYLVMGGLLYFLLRKTSRIPSYLVARNAETGSLIYFKIGNVRSAKYILHNLPPRLSIMNEFYLIASKAEKPWEKEAPKIGIHP